MKRYDKKQLPLLPTIGFGLVLVWLLLPFVAVNYESTINQTNATTISVVEQSEAPVAEVLTYFEEVPISDLRPVNTDYVQPDTGNCPPTWEELVEYAIEYQHDTLSDDDFLNSIADIVLCVDSMEEKHIRDKVFSISTTEDYDFSLIAEGIQQTVDLYNSTSSKLCILAFQAEESENGIITAYFFLEKAKYAPEAFGQYVYVVVGGTVYESAYGNGSLNEGYLKPGIIVQVNGLAFNDEKGHTLKSYHFGSDECADPFYMPFQGPLTTTTTMLHVTYKQPVGWMVLDNEGTPDFDTPILAPLPCDLPD